MNEGAEEQTIICDKCGQRLPFDITIEHYCSGPAGERANAIPVDTLMACLDPELPLTLAALPVRVAARLEPLLRAETVLAAHPEAGSESPKAIAAWVREQAEGKDYGAACEWRNVANAIEAEAEDTDWRCECGDLNRDHEAFCYRCGAGPPEDDRAPHPETDRAPDDER